MKTVITVTIHPDPVDPSLTDQQLRNLRRNCEIVAAYAIADYLKIPHEDMTLTHITD